MFAAAKLDKATVSEAIANALTAHLGIDLAITPASVAKGPDPQLIERIRNNIHPTRAGDIYVVQAPC